LSARRLLFFTITRERRNLFLESSGENRAAKCEIRRDPLLPLIVNAASPRSPARLRADAAKPLGSAAP